jgi:hypothetical protein
MTLAIGLCADCVHARRMMSDRGSLFLQCQLSFTDSRFQKYPRLPILTCSGYEKQSVSERTRYQQACPTTND